MRTILIPVCLWLCAVSLPAADLTGIWTGQMTNKYGEVEDISFRFSRNPAQTWSGKIYDDSQTLPVDNLKIEDERISFSVTTEMNGGPRKFVYAGVLKDGELQLTRQREMQPGDAVPQTGRPAPQRLTLKRLLPGEEKGR